MIRSLISSGVSWIFSKGFSMPLLIVVSLGLGLLWRNAVELSEVQAEAATERLKNEQTISLSWRAEALRLQGVVMGSADTLAACLDRETEFSQTQMDIQRLTENLRKQTEEAKRKSVASGSPEIDGSNETAWSPENPCAFCSSFRGHEKILQHLERPLETISPSKILLAPVASEALPNNSSTKVSP